MRAPPEAAPSNNYSMKTALLLLRVGRSGGPESAVLEDVGRLGIGHRIELLEEVIGREPLVAGRARIKAAQRGAAQIGDLLGRHLGVPLAVEALPEVLVVFGAGAGPAVGLGGCACRA